MGETKREDGRYGIVIIGAGRAGRAIARALSADPRFAVTMADPVEENARDARDQGAEVRDASGGDREAMKKLLRNADVAIVAAPDSVAPPVAEAAREAGCHYLDLSEDAGTGERVAAIAAGADRVFVPHCGLAPGYVSSLVMDAAHQAGIGADIRVYVGVLPEHRTNRLGYGNMWNIDGLMTEYLSPCRVIQEGKPASLPPLSRHETLTLDGSPYEAFTTSGSLDGLVDQLADRVASLVFKTLRYPGHLDYIRFLIDDLGLSRRPDFLRNLLLNGLPVVENDKVVIAINARSRKEDAPGGLPRERTYYQTISARHEADGAHASAISVVTAAHACSMIDLLCSGHAPSGGILRHEDVALPLLRRSSFFEPLLAGERPVFPAR